VKSKDGSLYHFYSASAIIKKNEYRGLDLLTPVSNFPDLTPDGRREWSPSVQYDEMQFCNCFKCRSNIVAQLCVIGL
jgi:hypothetical protein